MALPSMLIGPNPGHPDRCCSLLSWAPGVFCGKGGQDRTFIAKKLNYMEGKCCLQKWCCSDGITSVKARKIIYQRSQGAGVANLLKGSDSEMLSLVFARIFYPFIHLRPTYTAALSRSMTSSSAKGLGCPACYTTMAPKQ